MILMICAVYDLKAHCYSNPFYIAHEDLAIRAFGEAVKTAGNPINKYPADHVLYLLGRFDDGTGEFSILPAPRLLVAGASLSMAPAATVTELREAFDRESA